jgi:HK97 family phage major capsid protein/HK97 family phage prohead protease
MPIKHKLEKLEPQRRALSMRGQEIKADTESRTVRFSFSSEEPVDMWYGTEILSHTPGAVRIDQRQQTMPLLFNHDRDDLLGVVESIGVGADKRGYCDVRFGRDDRGDWAMKQYNDDVLVNVSFMYRVFKFIEDTEEETYTAIDWEPYEISLVTVPADASVGKGRSVTDEAQPVSIESRSKSATTAAPASAESLTLSGDTDMFKRKFVKQDPATDGTTGASGGNGIDQNALRLEAATNERQRAAEIEALCQAHGVDADLRRGLIQRGASVAEARGAVLDIVLQRGATQKPTASLGNGHAPDMSEGDKGRYSMLRAINASISNNWKDAGFELEVSNDIAKRMGKDTKGFFMPTNIPFAQRAQYASGAAATGGALVASNLLTGSFIEVLRNKARVLQLGATVLSGLTGNVVIPRQTGTGSSYWVAETGSVTESEATFDQLALSFKSIGTKSAITRSMLMQSTPDVEMIARADLIAQLALGIDLAALSGSGSSNQPLGIANTAGIGSVVAGANGAQLTIDHLIALETAIATANADVDNMAYLANAKSVGWLKGLKSTTGQYLWTNQPNGGRGATPGEINGYTVARSNQARGNLTKGTSSSICSELFMGNWSELIIGEWGVLEIMPNPYDATLFPQGGVLLRAMQSCDIGVRHAASFATISDALTS